MSASCSERSTKTGLPGKAANDSLSRELSLALGWQTDNGKKAKTVSTKPSRSVGGWLGGRRPCGQTTRTDVCSSANLHANCLYNSHAKGAPTTGTAAVEQLPRARHEHGRGRSKASVGSASARAGAVYT